MVHETHHKNPSGHSIQTAIALVLFILGLMLLVVWAILYANRLSNNLDPEWWIWFFLGFGVGLMVIGLIWLIIVQYMVGSKTAQMYEQLCCMQREHEFGEHELPHRHTAAETRTGVTRRKTGSLGSFAHNE